MPRMVALCMVILVLVMLGSLRVTSGEHELPIARQRAECQAEPVRSHELTLGRTFGIVFDPGEDFFGTLATFCTTHNVRQGYIPMFLAAFAEAEIVGTCERISDPDAPLWSKVHLTNVEALGCGTLGYNPETERVLPHIHTSLGLKERSAVGHTSHLLSARVQFLVEMLLVEIATPTMLRTPEPSLYDIPLLRFG